MATSPIEKPHFGDLSNLSPEKLKDLWTVLNAILALPIAQETYAQIIDGNPTHTPYSDEYKNSDFFKTIIVGDDLKPSDEASREYEKISTSFVPQELIVDLQLAQRYQDAVPNSWGYYLCLLEIAAASINALAGRIFMDFHKDTEIMPPRPPEGHSHQFHRTDRFYVNFYHTKYRSFENYPLGLVNVVGYWAEAEILGGVILSERGESDTKIINAFLHPQKMSHAFQLSEEQLKAFANLSIAEEESARAETRLLPFAREPDARTEPTWTDAGEPPLRIYKSEYDKPPVRFHIKRQPCVIKQGDKDDPRAAPMEAAMKEAMRLVEQYEREQASRTSLQNASSLTKDPSSSSSSSFKDPPSANKRGL